MPTIKTRYLQSKYIDTNKAAGIDRYPVSVTGAHQRCTAGGTEMMAAIQVAP